MSLLRGCCCTMVPTRNTADWHRMSRDLAEHSAAQRELALTLDAFDQRLHRWLFQLHSPRYLLTRPRQSTRERLQEMTLMESDTKKLRAATVVKQKLEPLIKFLQITRDISSHLDESGNFRSPAECTLMAAELHRAGKSQ